MGTSKIGGGVEIREKSIRLFFVWNGTRYRETLTIGGKVAMPTAANIKHAHRTALEIRNKINVDAFVLAEYFPDSPRAKQTIATDERNFGQWCELWLETKGRLAKNTRDQYRCALEIWKSLYGAESAMKDLTHAVIAAKVGNTPWKSPKLLNNYLISLRGVFTLAGRELKIEDPMDGIENSKHQPPQPDPLSPDEMEQVLAHLREKLDVRAWAYFEFAFMTGMRPEELIELRWGDVDWKSRTIRVERARTAGEVKPLKTYNARDVDMVSRAIAALEVMKPWTMVGSSGPEDGPKGRQIFENPGTDKPWHDERSQRDTYWRPALRAAGIRWRRAYQTRHTYATNALGAGVNPAYIARQMGHKNAKMLFTVYAKWIDGADRGRELAKLEAVLRNEKTAQKAV
ncbi:tyrosine-type recombinase/integrase [Diaphorobacter sp. HDW4B]|uniref:site-specific integrase n=1 Tax=Diaphorobacter sp. HDW4B TaxID=2714925 RepID=UPI0014079E64|nr:site-specific integrase [Diaphorobacter sp. HDW4B]QIL69594.1 tyrosine-type recombinase/integrase [Diaphorobacter sp. HDW4B]